MFPRTAATQTTPQPPAPPAPPAGHAPQPPAPPAPPAQATRKFWCSINGASVIKTEAEARALPSTTQAMPEDQVGGWSTLAALLGAAPASTPAQTQPMGRPAFGQRTAPVQQQQPAQQGGRGMFAGVENAEVIRRGNNINPGDYICRVCQAEYKPGRTKTFVIIELEVLKSTYEDGDPARAACNREGSRMTNFVLQNDSFASNVKEIVLAVSGFDAQGQPRDQHDTVTQAECEALVSPEQPFAGAIVYIEAREVPTRAGGIFTRVSWWPCPIKADGTPDEDRLAQTR